MRSVNNNSIEATFYNISDRALAALLRAMRSESEEEKDDETSQGR